MLDLEGNQSNEFYERNSVSKVMRFLADNKDVMFFVLYDFCFSMVYICERIYSSVFARSGFTFSYTRIVMYDRYRCRCTYIDIFNEEILWLTYTKQAQKTKFYRKI